MTDDTTADDDLAQRVEDLTARVDALNRARTHLMAEVEELRDENEELRGKLAEIEQVVEPDPGSTEYKQLTKEQKIYEIRKTLAETAGRTNGRGALKYKEVKMLFDGHPSPGHCYDLMERAGELDGYTYDEAGGGKGEKRIRVKLDGVNDEALIHAANKAAEGTAV